MVGLGMTVFQPQIDDGATPALSSREREVLDLMARGATNREIAAALHLSPHTIHEHTSSLYRKLGARNRADAVQRAARLGLIDERARSGSAAASHSWAAPNTAAAASLRRCGRSWRTGNPSELCR